MDSYLVLLRVGFTVPVCYQTRGALLPHHFTLTTHVLRHRSAVCSLLHWPSAHAAQALPGTLPYGARTFLQSCYRSAIVWPTPRLSYHDMHYPELRTVRHFHTVPLLKTAFVCKIATRLLIGGILLVTGDRLRPTGTQ